MRPEPTSSVALPDVSPWRESDDERAMLRKALETAANGSVVRRELPWTASGENDGSEDVSAEIDRADSDRSRTLSVTIRPVRDETGTVSSVLVRAEDVTERAGLEQELRESEELHRVTLNNMTDTVLVTDDDGEFTYVCPNVHFIFGYDDDEIHEMGTIDELLGAELFDREELAEEGVLTNIECTATDEAGREHTLLVNVREVSIQDGTTLYSCRDVTERKRRDEALTALHRTTRRLLAETDREIVDLVVGMPRTSLPSRPAGSTASIREQRPPAGGTPPEWRSSTARSRLSESVTRTSSEPFSSRERAGSSRTSPTPRRSRTRRPTSEAPRSFRSATTACSSLDRRRRTSSTTPPGS